VIGTFYYDSREKKRGRSLFFSEIFGVDIFSHFSEFSALIFFSLVKSTSLKFHRASQSRQLPDGQASTERLQLPLRRRQARR
jgi:hypothetical protein